MICIICSVSHELVNFVKCPSSYFLTVYPLLICCCLIVIMMMIIIITLNLESGRWDSCMCISNVSSLRLVVEWWNWRHSEVGNHLQQKTRPMSQRLLHQLLVRLVRQLPSLVHRADREQLVQSQDHRRGDGLCRSLMVSCIV